jgi:hypothetical protein
MNKREAIPDRLEHVATELTERGQKDLASEVRSVVADLRESAATELPPMLTTGQAAQALGIRSVFTIKRWVREGILDGQRRGSRIFVTRESVERLLRSPTVAEERARDLEPGGAGEQSGSTGSPAVPRDFWNSWDSLTKAVSEQWPPGLSAVDAVREGRRDL